MNLILLCYVIVSVALVATQPAASADDMVVVSISLLFLELGWVKMLAWAASSTRAPYSYFL